MTVFRALDPRSKLVIVLCVSSLAIFIEEVLPLLALVVLSSLLAAGCGSNLGSVFHRLRRILWIFLIMAVVQSVFTPGGSELLRVGRVVLLTSAGLARGLVIILRIMIIIISAAIMTTSSAREIIQGLAQWGIPFEITFMVAVAIRFLPLLESEARDALTAIQLRGVELEKIPWRKKIDLYYRLLMPLVSSVIIKSRQLAVAVEMRAFRAYPRRTSFRELRFTVRDYLIMTASVLATSGVFIAYYFSF